MPNRLPHRFLCIINEKTHYLFKEQLSCKINVICFILNIFVYRCLRHSNAGTDVIINHWALHNDPNKWRDVDKFMPERYLNEEGKMGPKPESWLPFSAGRRVCLGESVAKPELHLLFAFCS